MRIMTKINNRRKFQPYRQNLRNNITKSEVVLWKFIKGDRLGCRFRRQYGIGNFILDFYCPKLKLAIEVDGITHAEESVFIKDQKKQKYLENLGITVKRYNSNEIFNNLENILTDLEVACKLVALPTATPPTPS